MRKSTSNGNLHWSKCRKGFHDVLISKRIATWILDKGINQADHDDEEKSLQFA